MVQAPDWIENNQKFALIGVDVGITDDINRFECPGGLIGLPNADFEFPEHWKLWLGSLRIEDIESCSLYLLATMASTSPSVLDAENKRLQGAVGDWFTGLTLIRKFGSTDAAFTATGSCVNGVIDVRQFGSIDPPLASIVHDDRPISRKDLQDAFPIARGLAKLRQSTDHNRWRLHRCMNLYQEARCERGILERIHQFTRCIEGLIAPKQGQTLRQFKSRTELFVGPHHHELMGDLYRVRSDVEHLHENQHLEEFDRQVRIHLAKLEAVSEWVSRSCLARILRTSELVLHFGNVAAIGHFWAKPEAERRALWGDPINPCATLTGFNFNRVSDGELGAHE
ncbi:hypothetical protein [Labrenzia sp. OB1]|uniref:hypothetical protein n=1 Tax=Labrenzia sp. OB1 TaxID=1561204 RepID=UPI0007B1C5BF|nr:hypothetical protein [Labrenzia sp. OB1]KZM49436.1 hypothetical protein OA90_15275 [Labrenzia sp. OB1]